VTFGPPCTSINLTVQNIYFCFLSLQEYVVVESGSRNNCLNCVVKRTQQFFSSFSVFRRKNHRSILGNFLTSNQQSGWDDVCNAIRETQLLECWSIKTRRIISVTGRIDQSKFRSNSFIVFPIWEKYTWFYSKRSNECFCNSCAKLEVHRNLNLNFHFQKWSHSNLLE
jgi:hypothetical protein